MPSEGLTADACPPHSQLNLPRALLPRHPSLNIVINSSFLFNANIGRVSTSVYSLVIRLLRKNTDKLSLTTRCRRHIVYRGVRVSGLWLCLISHARPTFVLCEHTANLCQTNQIIFLKVLFYRKNSALHCFMWYSI